MDTDRVGLPRPAVTIVDPAAPRRAGAAPMGDRGRPPLWRPGRRTWAVVGGTLVVVAALSAGRDALDARHASHVAARRAARAAAVVEIRIGGPGGSSTTGGAAVVGVRLVNAGPRPVRLETAQLDVEGWIVRLPAEPVGAGASTLLELRRQVDCPAVDRLRNPAIVLVTVRTEDGRSHSTSLGLGPQDAADPARQVREALFSAPRRACGVLPPIDAFAVDLAHTWTSRRPGSVLAVVPIANTSSRPLTLLSVRGIDGLAVVSASRLPVLLPAGRGSRFAMVLTLADCRTPLLRQARIAVTLRGEGADYAETETDLGAATVAAVNGLGAHRCR